MLNELSKQIYEANKAKGFWPEDPKERNIGELIALIHSEVSETLEAHRTGEPWPGKEEVDDMLECLKDMEEGGSQIDVAVYRNSFEYQIKNSVPDELADVIIRVLDFAGAYGIDIESHIKLKLAYNKLRPYKHGKLL